MDNRLLSYEEKQKAIQKCHTAAEFENCITSAQLAKTDRWWIKRLNEESIVIRLTDGQGEFAPGDYIAIPIGRWQQLEKELAVKHG